MQCQKGGNIEVDKYNFFHNEWLWGEKTHIQAHA